MQKMFAIEGDIHNSDNNKSQACLSTSTCSYDRNYNSDKKVE